MGRVADDDRIFEEGLRKACVSCFLVLMTAPVARQGEDVSLKRLLLK